MERSSYKTNVYELYLSFWYYFIYLKLRFKMTAILSILI